MKRGVKNRALLESPAATATPDFDPSKATGPAVLDKPAPLARVEPAPVADPILVIAELAKDPAVDTVKLDKIIASFERLQALKAKADFDAAYSLMQGDIPVISEKGEILVNGQLRSRFAKFEDIREVVTPILAQHGFALRFHNTLMDDGRMRIVGILSHRGGHSEQDEFISPADTSGGKSDIQARGSTRSYGQRYTTIALLNIATRGEDNDGQKEPPPRPEPPAGYEDWLSDLAAVADNGTDKLQESWKASASERRDYVMKHQRARWESIKSKAAKAAKGAARAGA